MLQILYRDDHLVAINKPHGLLVHRSPIAMDAEEFALQILRDQISHWVNPVHRIDRKTGGVLLFALDKATEVSMHQLFANNQVQKRYLAIVRGYTLPEETIDYALRKENGTLQEAVTRYRTLRHSEIDTPSASHATSRYSLVEAIPETGRMHQLRKHFAHIHHPIIGDRPHGCNKQNRLFKENWGITNMMLHASEVSFKHPVSQKDICIKAYLQESFAAVMRLMGWETPEAQRAQHLG